MFIFDRIKNIANDLGNSAKRFQNATFKEAVISICALVASADGTIANSEIESVAAAIQSFDALKIFDARELGQLFRSYSADAVDVYGRINLKNNVAKLASNREAAITAIEIGLQIAKSDGKIAPEEVVVLRELLKKLNLNESDLSQAL